MKKNLVTLLVLLTISLFYSPDLQAQMGFNPEYLGNANAPGKTGLALKNFVNYFYQNRIKASDVEYQLEVQYYTKGFRDDIKKDMFQWAVHIPVGYRYQNAPESPKQSITGLGSIVAIIEYYYNIIDEEDLTFWFDNGITLGFPTSMRNKGYRLGSDNYAVTWFQENFIKYKKFMTTINPISVTWSFRDKYTHERAGLGLNVLNGSSGYELLPNAFFGISYGLTIGNIVGADDGYGNAERSTLRAYVGPAALIGIGKHSSLQISGVIDAYTRKTDRGQGIFTVFWHQF